MIRIQNIPNREMTTYVFWFLSNDFNHTSNSRTKTTVSPKRTTREFTTETVPVVGIPAYARRCSRFMNYSNYTVLAAGVYLYRLCWGYGVEIDQCNFTNALFVSLVVACKYHEDTHFSNRHFAKVGGMSLATLNRLEAIFLARIDYDLQTDIEDLIDFYCDLIRFVGIAGGGRRFFQTTENVVPDIKNCACD